MRLRVQRISMLAGFSFAAAVLATPGAYASSGGGGTAGSFSYTAYFGGVAAVEIDARIKLANARYDIETFSQSVGFLDYLFPFSSTVTGQGWLDQARGGDRRFVLASRYRDRDRLIKLTGRSGASPGLSVSPPIPLEDRDPVPDALRRGTLDPVAALVAGAMRGAAAEACEGTFPVFNGKARTDVRLRHLGTERLAPSRYSAFSGTAEKCEATYEVLAGGYKKSWFASDRPPPAVKLWIARIGEARFWTPVRAWADGGIAEIVVHMTAARLGTGFRIGLR